MKKCCLFVLFVFCASVAMSQDAAQLIKKVKAKLELVDNYEATGVMKTDIAFIIHLKLINNRNPRRTYANISFETKNLFTPFIYKVLNRESPVKNVPLE